MTERSRLVELDAAAAPLRDHPAVAEDDLADQPELLRLDPECSPRSRPSPRRNWPVPPGLSPSRPRLSRRRRARTRSPRVALSRSQSMSRRFQASRPGRRARFSSRSSRRPLPPLRGPASGRGSSARGRACRRRTREPSPPADRARRRCLAPSRAAARCRPPAHRPRGTRSSSTTKLSQGSSRSANTAECVLAAADRTASPSTAADDGGDELEFRRACSRRTTPRHVAPGLERICGRARARLAHTGITPCFFQGRSTRLSAAIRRPLMIVGRVSRGSMMSSIERRCRRRCRGRSAAWTAVQHLLAGRLRVVRGLDRRAADDVDRALGAHHRDLGARARRRSGRARRPCRSSRSSRRRRPCGRRR